MKRYTHKLRISILVVLGWGIIDSVSNSQGFSTQDTTIMITTVSALLMAVYFLLEVLEDG